MNTTVRPFWPPLVGGVSLGLLLLFTFVVTGHGLGASGFFTRAFAALGQLASPAVIEVNRYLRPYVTGSPLSAWISWEVLGIMLGALVGSLTTGRFQLVVERGPRTGVAMRLGLALGGGMLVGFGSRLARGCTSGLGLSGGATLAVAGFVFLIAFFAAGFVAAAFTRKYWQ